MKLFKTLSQNKSISDFILEKKNFFCSRRTVNSNKLNSFTKNFSKFYCYLIRQIHSDYKTA